MNDKTDISRLIKESWAQGDPSGWFEHVYANAANGEGVVPWAHMRPEPEYLEWLNNQPPADKGQRALVIGCGLGDDAEALAERGFTVTAFDISPTAINWCTQRFPESDVAYRVADLLNPPAEWRGAFDFVLESRTIQSLPYDLYKQAIAQIAAFVAPGGTLLVLCHGRELHQERRGIPWPIAREELNAFQQYGLTEHTFDDFSKNGLRRFRVEYRN